MAVAAVSLLPITIGALVTTLKAGMAFADWPSSDGQNMLLYPWLQDLRHTDKFVEHGHRLAGVLIGLFSIALTLITFYFERRRWVRIFSVAILLAVIAQGLLGGARVIQNRQTLAMLHSITGSLFFCLCVMFMVATGSRWSRLRSERDGRTTLFGFACLCFLPLAVFGQYMLGSAFRHLHTLLDEHIGGAVIVSVLSLAAGFVLGRSDSPGLRRCGIILLGALLLQVSLGLGAYVTRLGLPMTGTVATSGSLSQSIFCSLHTVGGMFLLSSSVVSAASALRLYHAGNLNSVTLNADLSIPQSVSAAQSGEGGAA